MKIGTRSHDILTHDVDELIAYCQKHGIDGLHTAMYKSFEDEFENDEKIMEYIQKIENAGIEIFVFGAYFNMIHPDTAKQQAGEKLFKRVSTTAKVANCKLVGSETGSLNGDAWTYNPENHTERTIAQSTGVIQKLIAENPDVQVLIEPVYDHVIHSIEEGKKVVDNERVKIILDLSNLLNINNYQDHLEIFEKALKTYGDDIKIFHLKNFRWENEEKKYCRLDKGELKYPELFNLIRKYNLDNTPLVIEDLQNEDLEESIKYLREL